MQNWELGMNGKKFFVLILIFIACNNIVERSSSDYFPMNEGNWWRYANTDIYEPAIIEVTVEAPESLLLQECYPFNFSGTFHYFLKDNEGIKEYIKITQNYGGEEYTILEGFIKRLELPLVKGNQYADSLIDSLDFFGSWVKCCYIINELVSDYEEDKLYGDVYKVVITTQKSIITPDSSITINEYLEEYYAPNIGMIRFKNSVGEFILSDYKVD